MKISLEDIGNPEILLSTEGGLYFINFFQKLMKAKIYPDNPVYPVYFKYIIESIPFHKSCNQETLLVLCSKRFIFKNRHSL